MYQYNLLGSIIKYTNGDCYLFFDFFFHFQKKYIPTPNRIYTPMNIYIGFTLSPKSHAMRRLVAVLNYLFLLIDANTTSMANMRMTIMCIGMLNKGYQLDMISLPIRPKNIKSTKLTTM